MGGAYVASRHVLLLAVLELAECDHGMYIGAKKVWCSLFDGISSYTSIQLR